MSKEDQKDNGQSASQNGVSDVYVNSIQFSMSIYDVTMDFGITNKTNQHQSLVRIKMSPQHAKVMSIVLKHNMEKYENTIGELNLPDQFLKELLKEAK